MSYQPPELCELPASIKDDALSLLCLELLGRGCSRHVYSCGLDPQKWVVKVESETLGMFQNVREYTVWEAVRWNKAIARWFAPIVNISDNGRFLVQERTRPVRIEELQKRLPKVPAFFSDKKPENWGWLGNRIVCHDYGTALTTEYGISMKTRNANWMG